MEKSPSLLVSQPSSNYSDQLLVWKQLEVKASTKQSVSHLFEGYPEAEKQEREQLLRELQVQMCQCNVNELSVEGEGSRLSTVLSTEEWEQWRLGIEQLESIEEKSELTSFHEIERKFLIHLNGHATELARRMHQMQEKIFEYVKVLKDLDLYDFIPRVKNNFGRLRSAFDKSTSLAQELVEKALELDEVCKKMAAQEINYQKEKSFSCDKNALLQRAKLFFNLAQEGHSLLQEASAIFIQFSKEFKTIQFSIHSIKWGCNQCRRDIKIIIDRIMSLVRISENCKKMRANLNKMANESLTISQRRQITLDQLNIHLSDLNQINIQQSFVNSLTLWIGMASGKNLLENCLSYFESHERLRKSMISDIQSNLDFLGFKNDTSMEDISKLPGMEHLDKFQEIIAHKGYEDEEDDVMRLSSSSSSGISSESNSPELSPGSSPPKSPSSVSPSSSLEEEPIPTRASESIPLLANRSAEVVPKHQAQSPQGTISRQPANSMQLRSMQRNPQQPEFACCIIA